MDVKSRILSKSLGAIMGIITLSSLSFLLNTTSSYAESSTIDNVTVTVPVSCSITATVGTAHTATVEVGTYTDEIGETTFKVLCNDANGFAVYAIGYSDDTYGNTVMKPSSVADTNAIATGTATSGGTSNWAMKLTAVSGDYSPTLATGFNAYHAVPAEYTKVASLGSSTDATVGSSFKSTYAAFVSQSQAADTYTGKVKYTVVHPSDAATPSTMLIMQEVGDWGSSVTAGQEVTAMDARDEKTYTVARLADGNLWMTQNLDFDIDSTKTYTPADTDIPANWTPSAFTYPTSGFGGYTWDYSYIAPVSYDPGNRYWNGTLDTTGLWADWFGGELDDEPYSTFVSSTGDSHYHLGNYYNWTAAVAMNDSSSYATDQTLIDQSICPAGWTLPRAGYGNDTFYALINEYDTWNSITHKLQNNTELWDSPIYLALSGPYAGWNGMQGNNAVFWSPVVSDSDNAYYMYLDLDGNVTPGTSSSSRDSGSSVRCIARPVTSTVTFTEP